MVPTFGRKSTGGRIFLLLQCAALKRGVNINVKRQAKILKTSTSIKNKHPGNLTNGVTSRHDNALSHVAQTVKHLLGRTNWEGL